MELGQQHATEEAIRQNSHKDLLNDDQKVDADSHPRWNAVLVQEEEQDGQALKEIDGHEENQGVLF